MARPLPLSLLFAVGCAVPDPLILLLDGPAEVRTDRMGVVGGPTAVLSDGSEPEGVLWSTTETEVAIIGLSGAVAVGPGDVTVIGRWYDQEVSWRLFVEPTVFIQFDTPPSVVPIDTSIQLIAEGHVQGGLVDPGPIAWSSSDFSLLEIDENGRITGRRPGTVYVTATTEHSEAMLEIFVE